MADAEPDCSIIVPLYNRSLFTRLFLLALRGVLPEKPRCEVLLVDNGSRDDTAAVLEELAGEYRVVRLPANRNFAGGCNAGAEASRGRYLYFLNNDTIPLHGFVEELVGALDGDASMVIAGSRLLYPDGRIQHAGLGINRVRLPAHLYHLCRGDLPAANRRRVVQAVTGASLVIRRRDFESLGGFDPGFRNSFEDVDLCLKAGASGGRVLYCPESVLYHFESVSEGRHDYDEENRLRFLGRWYDRVEPDEERIYAADGFDVDPRPFPESAFGLRYRLEQERLESRSWEVRATRLARENALLLSRLHASSLAPAHDLASDASVPSCPEPDRQAAGAAGVTAGAAVAVGAIFAVARPPLLVATDVPPRVESGTLLDVRLDVASGARAAPLRVELTWRPKGGAPVPAGQVELIPDGLGLASGRVGVQVPAAAGAWELVFAVAGGSSGVSVPIGQEWVEVCPRYGARYQPHAPARALAGRTLRVPVVLRNVGVKVWDSGGTFQLGYRWSAAAETTPSLDQEGRCAAVGERVGPGDHLTLLGVLRAPERPGTYRLAFDLVEEGVAWFSHLGVEPEVTTIEIEAPADAALPSGEGARGADEDLLRLLEERDQLITLERMEAEARRQRLLARVAELESGAAWLASEVAALKGARSDALAQLEAERRERERTIAELEAEQRRRDDLDRRLQAIEGSRLWRMLGPLRRRL